MVICGSYHLPLRIKETLHANSKVETHTCLVGMIRVDIMTTRGTVKRHDLAIIDGQRMIVSLVV
jgi:hypothetical protein